MDSNKQIITKELYDYIKELLVAKPLDIYDEEEDTAQAAIFELVKERKGIKDIGSANIAVAYTILREEFIEAFDCFDLTDEQTNIFHAKWDELFARLEQEGFLRKIPESTIKLVVDNTNDS